MNERYLPHEQVAARFGVKPRTLYDWYLRGYGPTRIKIGRRICYLESQVRTWEAEQEQTAAAVNGAA